MSKVLARWNEMENEAAATEIRPCCGSSAWVTRIVGSRPFRDEAALLAASDKNWNALGPNDWLEAFRSHPKIGESRASAVVGARSVNWSMEEQKNVAAAEDGVKLALTTGNRAYEEKVGFIFIVCATGKSAAEILAILERRLQNGKEEELRTAAEEQRQITQLRLKKWLNP